MRPRWRGPGRRTERGQGCSPSAVSVNTENVGFVKVKLIDPSGDVTPYDHALAAALARRGADVELITSRFLYGPVPGERDYE